MEHPKGLYFISSMETLTTFSFYGVRILLSLYMILVLFFTKDLTSNIYGIFSGFIFLTPLIGGYICDKYLGNHKSITLGMVLLSISMFILTGSASLYAGPLQEHGWFIFSTQEILFI
ncbi:MAG: MFS transporter, partial [archaeon]|nr:MFS transporter [archaeon]